MFKRLVRIFTLPVLALAFGCGGDDGGPVDPGGPDNPMTVSASKDNTLYEDTNGMVSNGAGNYIFAGVTNSAMSGAFIRRALIAFDVAGSGIPAGSTVDSVFLVLECSKTIVAGTPVSLHPATADWGEGTSIPLSVNEGGGANPPSNGDATWLHTFYPSSMWTNTGGDYNGTASATTTVAGVGSYTWGSTAAMVSDVQSWLDTPAGNFGWVIIGDETTDPTAKRFNSRQNGAASTQPRLIVYYTEP
jgi:hypothetical protein